MNDPDVTKLLFVADQQDVEAEVWLIMQNHPITKIRQFEEEERPPQESISMAFLKTIPDPISRPTHRK
jgi:hypothetical protein